MQFKLKKEIKNGRYFVSIELTEYNDHDKAKSTKFGTPMLFLKISDGRNAKLPITSISRLSPYGFYTQDEADQYAENIKEQILILKKEWSSLEDLWSDEEVL